MKKILFLNIFISIHSLAFGSDFTDLFKSEKFHEIQITNAASTTAEIDIFVQSPRKLLPKQEIRELPLASDYFFDNGARLRKFTNLTTKICDITIRQKKRLTLAANEQQLIRLPANYFVLGFCSENPSVSLGTFNKVMVMLNDASINQETTKGILDPTRVNVDFDENGLPIFLSLEHQINWCLDRFKPSKIIINNSSQSDCSLSYTVQHKGRNQEEIQKTVVAFENHYYRSSSRINNVGSLIFDDEKFKNLKVFNSTMSYISLFQTSADRCIRQSQKIEVELPIGWVRELKLSKDYDIVFDGDAIQLIINDSPSNDLVKQNLLNQLYRCELYDTGKKSFGNKIAYSFDSWNSLDVSTYWFATHKRFLEYFYNANGLTKQDIFEKRRRHIQKTNTTLQESLNNRLLSDLALLIPEIRHNIWITGKRPTSIPKNRLLHYWKQVQSNPSFNHILWLFYDQENPALFNRSNPEVQEYIDTIFAECPQVKDNVNVRFFNEVWPEFRGKDLFLRLLQHRRYTACSDVSRINAVFLEGGAYTDFGVEFNISLPFIFRNFNIFMMREVYLLAGTAFGAERGHKVLDNVLKFFDNIDRMPHAARNIAHGNPLVPWCAYGILTAMFDIYSNPEEDQFLPIPFSKTFIDVNQMHSWSGNAVHGQQSTNNPISDQEWFGDDYDTQKYDFRYFSWDTTPAMSQIIFNDFEDKNAKRISLSDLSTRIYYTTPATLQNVDFPKPRISHRSWLTNLENPCEAPRDRLTHYINSLRTLNLSRGWTHYFWCQDPVKIPNTVKILLDANVGIEIKTLDDISDVREGIHVFEALLNDKRYTNANDVMRMRIMKKFGGIYADLGVEIKRDISSLLDEYEYALLLAGEGYLDHTIIAAAPNSELVSAYLAKVDNLYNMTVKEKEITPTPQRQLCWTGCNYMNSYIDCRLTESTRILFLREGNSHLIRLHRMNSWNESAKFGNKALSCSTLNIFDVRPGNV